MNTSYRRRAAMFLCVVLAFFSLVVVWYSLLGTAIVFETARKIMEWEIARANRRAIADTYGGKTPEETIRMYIGAIEKQDYALARRYFAAGERAKEEGRFDGVPREKMAEYVSVMKETLAQGGTYDSTGGRFSIEGPISVRLARYPNGVWKLLLI